MVSTRQRWLLGGEGGEDLVDVADRRLGDRGDQVVLAREVAVDGTTERPASAITSCIDVLWKPSRWKQRRAESRIC